MTSKRHLATFLAAFCVFAMMMGATPAQAKWPGWQEVLKKIAPLMGMNGDQTEAVIFSIKHPSCASTIVSYTLAQDYSLVGFIGALKVSKLQSLPKIVPINGGNCKSLQPVRRAYEFVDKKGDEYLGKQTADFFRTMLAGQISAGKAEIDQEVASIPYIGTIISNWDCECDAAFDSNFPSEKLADQLVGTAIGIVKDVKNGDFGSALEKMITQLGPDVACKIGEEYSGVGAVPIVNTVVDQACTKVAGKVVGWVVNAAGDAYDALTDNNRMPVEQYYQTKFKPYVGNPEYAEWADILYSNCYGYYESGDMSKSTAKKACGVMRQQYIDETLAYLDWKNFQYERGTYYYAQVEPKAKSSAMLTDAEFGVVKQQAGVSCKSYFLQKYPKANIYAKANGMATMDATCDDFVTYNKSDFHPWDMSKARAKQQHNVVLELNGKLAPFCSWNAKDRNLLKCQDGQGMTTCQQNLPKSCVKSYSELGGYEVPCCEGGGQPDQFQKFQAEAAAKLATDYGKPYCFTEAKDPLRIVCTLQKAFEKCSNAMVWDYQKDCKKAPTYNTGLVSQICCSLEPSRITEIPGVLDVKKATDVLNGKTPKENAAKESSGKAPLSGSMAGLGNLAGKADLSNADKAAQNIKTAPDKGTCDIGGTFEQMSVDVRVINCTADRMEDCRKEIGNSGACVNYTSGFVQKPCCGMSVFGGSGGATAEDTYNPADRSKDDLEKAQAIVAASGGACAFGSAPDGTIDFYHIICNGEKATKACLAAAAGDPLRASCKNHIAKNGYAMSVCCERDPSWLTINVSKPPKPNNLKGLTGAANDAEKNLKSAAPDLPSVPVPPVPAPKAESGKAKAHAPAMRVDGLVDIRLLKVKPLGGVSPFKPGDVVNKIDPNALQAKDGHAAPKPAAGIEQTAPTGSEDMPPSGNRASGGAAPTGNLRMVAPAGFSCEGKPDGTYCKDINTQVLCARDAVADTQHCPSGCNNSSGTCNPYKP